MLNIVIFLVDLLYTYIYYFILKLLKYISITYLLFQIKWELKNTSLINISLYYVLSQNEIKSVTHLKFMPIKCMYIKDSKKIMNIWKI